MEHLLEYRFQTGETLEYRQTTDYAYQGQTGQTVFQVKQRVLGRVNGIYTIEFTQHFLSQSGAFGEVIEDVHTVFQMDKHGAVFAEATTPAAFPTTPVAAGSTWTVAQEGGPETVFRVERIEKVGDGALAYLSSDSELVQGEERTRVRGEVTFDVMGGRQMRAQTVVESSLGMQTTITLDLV